MMKRVGVAFWLPVVVGLTCVGQSTSTTNTPSDTSILTNPAVVAAIAAAATNLPASMPHYGIGSSRTGRSIGSDGGRFGSEQMVTVTTVSVSGSAPTNAVAVTNASATGVTR